jgi:hypothetical protein
MQRSKCVWYVVKEGKPHTSIGLSLPVKQTDHAFVASLPKKEG